MFLAVISYILGFAMETFIPSRGVFRYLNPVRFSRSRLPSISPFSSILSTEKKMP